MGWKNQPTRLVSLTDVKVSKNNLIGEEGDGFKIAMQGLDGGRINIATCSIGTAQSALEEAQKYMNEREQFGKKISEFQAMQFKIADMVTELVAARTMTRLAASKVDSNDPEATIYSAMAKRFATDVGFKVCNEALQIFGGYGYIQEYPLERYVRDVRVHQILEGTNEIMKMIIGRRMIMEDAASIIQ
jgi:alkylation response protein AidB-like acyl-CoA dehydrogenase